MNSNFKIYSKTKLSTSMQNLDVFEEDEEITFKDKLKRTFSSIKRRTRTRKQIEHKPIPSRAHKPLRAVQSVPCTSISR